MPNMPVRCESWLCSIYQFGIRLQVCASVEANPFCPACRCPTAWSGYALQAMEQRYTALAEEQGRLAAENERLAAENRKLSEVLR